MLLSFISIFLEKNGLLYMETSALGSVNVEAAFNTVLAGKATVYSEHIRPYLHVLYMCSLPSGFLLFSQP